MPKYIPKFRSEEEYDEENFNRKKKTKKHNRKSDDFKFDDYYNGFDNEYQKSSRKRERFY